MKIDAIQSSKVFTDNEKFVFMVGHKHYNLGFQVKSWGIRFMFIWWHIVIHR